MPVAEMFPSLRGTVDLCFSDPATTDLGACNVVFFATPTGVAMEQAPGLLQRGVKVIDLAADFRLKNVAALSVLLIFLFIRPGGILGEAK